MLVRRKRNPRLVVKAFRLRNARSTFYCAVSKLPPLISIDVTHLFGRYTFDFALANRVERLSIRLGCYVSRTESGDAMRGAAIANDLDETCELCSAERQCAKRVLSLLLLRMARSEDYITDREQHPCQ